MAEPFPKANGPKLAHSRNITMLNTKLSKWLACIGLTLFGAPSAWAACIPNPPLEATAAGFTLTIDSTKNVGDLLGTQTLVVAVNGTVQCYSRIGMGYWVTPLPTVTVNGVNYLDIGMPGVGMIMTSMTYGRNVPFNWVWNDGNSTAQLSNETYKFSFYKIGDITSAGSFTGLVAQRGFATGNVGSYSPISYVLNINIGAPIIIIPKLPTCSVSTNDVRVNFDPVAASAFGGVGSIVGSKDFVVSLNCSGGDPGISTGVYMTLTDATNPGSHNDWLTLASSSTASGVGIKIYQQGNPTAITFGADSRTIGNAGQFKVTNAGNQSLNIPFTAKYVKTATTLRGGEVVAVATFTMAYN